MPRESLDRKINNLKEDILILTSMVEVAVLQSIDSLKKQDLALANMVIRNDEIINQKRFAMENDIIITIATTQPVMAKDLRLIASILEIVGELERMGDYAKGIARVTTLYGKEPHIKPLIDLPKMAELAIEMLHQAIEAFIAHDAKAARIIPDQDDQIDNLYNQIYRELVVIMFENPSVIDRANHLLWAAHNIERLADRVANICERTIYIATGELMELSVSDDEYEN
jgi:phosphate transport system protein